MKLRPFKPLESRQRVVPSLNIRLPEWINQDRIRDFIAQNRAGVAAGGVILAVILIFLFLYGRHQRTVETRSSAMFREAQGLYSYQIPAGDSEQAPLVASDEEKYQRAQQYFQQIIEAYPGSRYAPPSLYYTGNCRYRLRQYASALEAFDQFISRYGRNHLIYQAHLGRADCLEQLGRHQEALESYRKVMNPKSGLATEASLGAVRCLLKMTEIDRPNANKWWGEAAGILQKLENEPDPYSKKVSRTLQKLLVDLSKAK